MNVLKKIFVCLVVMSLFLPSIKVEAAETTYSKNENDTSNDIPTINMTKLENGKYIVEVIDCDGNVMYLEEISGTIETILLEVYNKILTPVANTYGVIGGPNCTHIPCNHKIVQGGINHIIDGDICIMVTTKFYQCACCGAIIGMVEGSTEIVGTHPAH